MFPIIHVHVYNNFIDKRINIPCVAVRGALPPSTHFLEVVAGDYISKKLHRYYRKKPTTVLFKDHPTLQQSINHAL